MLDDRTQYLIDCSIDKVLDATEQAELELILKRSPAARAELAGLQDLDATLRSLPMQDVPVELTNQIITEIDFPPPPQRKTNAHPQTWSSGLRFGIAASVGLLLAVGIYETRTGGIGNGDHDRMVGTIAASGQHSERMLDALKVEMPGLRSQATLSLREGIPVLDVTLYSDDTIELTIDFGDGDFSPEWLDANRGKLDSFSTSGTTVRTQSRGQQRLMLQLNKNTHHTPADKAVIRLDYSQNGVSLYRDALIAGDAID